MVNTRRLKIVAKKMLHLFLGGDFIAPLLVE
jgi:hypothetical protein